MDPGAIPAPVPTYRLRERQFVQYLQEHGSRMLQVHAEGNHEAIVAGFSEAVDLLGLNLSWCTGPGRTSKTLGLQLSPEGCRAKRMVTGWLTRDFPSIGGIDLFPAKAPSLESGWSLRINGTDVEGDDFRVLAQISPDHRSVDITVFHPTFSTLEEGARDHIAYLWCDEVLGEDVVSDGIGTLTTEVGTAPGGATDMDGLVERLRTLLAELNQEIDQDPLDTWSLLELPEASRKPDGFRADAMGGTSRFAMAFLLWTDPTVEDPLAGTGIELACLGMPRHGFTAGQETDQREAIADAIEAASESSRSSFYLGGAFSEEWIYIDLLCTDRGTLEAELRSIAAETPAIVAGSQLRYHATGDSVDLT